MGWTTHVRSLIEYNEWSNDHLLEAASRLGEEEFGRQVSGSYESVRMSLVHIVRVQSWWLSVLKGQPKAEAPPKEFERIPFGELRQWFAKSHAELRDYAAGLTDEQLAAEVSAFHPGEGKEYRWPSWQLATHLVNHGTQHRSEAGLMLASLGQKLRDLDFVYFVGERSS